MTWAPLSILRDIEHSLPPAQRLSFRVLARGRGVANPISHNTVRQLLLWYGAGRPPARPDAIHDAILGRGRPDRIRLRPPGDLTCEIAYQAEDQRQAGGSAQDGDRAAGAVERSQHRRRRRGSPARRRAV